MKINKIRLVKGMLAMFVFMVSMILGVFISPLFGLFLFLIPIIDEL